MSQIRRRSSIRGCASGYGRPDGASARAFLKAVGFTDEDLARPLVVMATKWIETMPATSTIAAWSPPPPHYESGVFARYAALVSPASDGAVLRANLRR